MATLTVRREPALADSKRNYRILVDGVEIGRLGTRAELRHALDEGLHGIEARIDGCVSRPLHLDVTSSDPTVVVNSALSGWRFYLAPLLVLIQPRQYLNLEQVS